MAPREWSEQMADVIKFVVEYVDGSHAIITIDRHALDRGDQVAKIIAREQQVLGQIPKGEIASVRRA